MRNRKRGVIGAIILMSLGLFRFLNSLSNPRLSILRVADYLQMISVGLLLGVGLSLLVGSFRPSRNEP
jgi:ABC-type nickel/cobalt efflux system permease component RcnA